MSSRVAALTPGRRDAMRHELTTAVSIPAGPGAVGDWAEVAGRRRAMALVALDAAEAADRQHQETGDALDRVRDLLFDWGQDFVDDEDVRMHDMLEDLWSAIAGMPEGAKVDALPSRAPVVCPHLRDEQPAFAATWDALWEELTRLRAARDRVRGVCDLAEQIASTVAGPRLIAVDDVRAALGGDS